MDLEFLFPRLLTELLLPGLYNSLNRKSYRVSFSRVVNELFSGMPDFSLNIQRLRETVVTSILITCDSETDRNIIINTLKLASENTSFILEIITGKKIKKVTLEKNSEINYTEKNFYRYNISLRKETDEIIITILLPLKFFNILIPSLTDSIPYENICEKVIPFFKKPDLLYPSIALLLEKIGSKELSEILNLLKLNKQLSDYQLVLLIKGFPEHALTIKNSLSKNQQESLKCELKKYRGKVTREDISCGIYSVEESLGNILQKEKNYFSEWFSTLALLIKKISDYELLTRKSWDQWIEEIEHKNILYKTFLKCSDLELNSAFKENQRGREAIFKKYFSEERIKEIFSAEASAVFLSLPEARIAVIKKYRNIITETFRFNHENFSYIISSVKNENDFEIIVRHTGWFTLSTALKKCGKKLQERVTGSINYPASVLVKGVLSGTINPDIIQDEIQINRARSECVRVILQLYEDGLIEPDI